MFKKNVMCLGILLFSGMVGSLSCADREKPTVDLKQQAPVPLPSSMQPRNLSPLPSSPLVSQYSGAVSSEVSDGRSPRCDDYNAVPVQDSGDESGEWSFTSDLSFLFNSHYNDFFSLCAQNASAGVINQEIFHGMIVYSPTVTTNLSSSIDMHASVLTVLNDRSTRAFLIDVVNADGVVISGLLELVMGDRSVIFDSPSVGEKYYRRIINVGLCSVVTGTPVAIEFGLERVNNPYDCAYGAAYKLVIFVQPEEAD